MNRKRFVVRQCRIDPNESQTGCWETARCDPIPILSEILQSEFELC